MQKKNLFSVFLSIFLIISVAVSAYAFLSGKPSPDSAAASSDTESYSETDVSEKSYQEISYNGKQYEYNMNLSNYLFLGIDKNSEGTVPFGHAQAGQADTIVLISWNRKTDEVTRFSIPRDTMTPIHLFSPDQKDLGWSSDHLSLSFAYGDGGYRSRRLTMAAVSRLFYDIPIERTISMDLDTMPDLARTVGAFNVILPNDSLIKLNPEWKTGFSYPVSDQSIETLLRYRDTTAQNSAFLRMEREQAFLDSYFEMAKQRYHENPSGFAGKAYRIIQKGVESEMTLSIFTNLLSDILKGNGSSLTLPGQIVQGTQFEEFHVDDNALYQMLIRYFYIEKK